MPLNLSGWGSRYLRAKVDVAELSGLSLIAPSAGGATVRQQLVFFPADRSAHRLVIYDDDVVRIGDRWLFRSRQCRFMTEQGTLPDP